MTIKPSNVLDDLKKNMLVDGFPIVMDLENSHGNRIVDRISGEEYHDFFTGFATIPFSYNHPKLKDKDFLEKIHRTAVTKITNSDIYSTELAESVETFRKIAIPDYLPHLFFISGGALAVENALKTAFDWKVKKNWEKGVSKDKEVGSQVIHFREAFHGRSGYTLSLTNTDPAKILHFPKFKWPRIDNPKIKFPLKDNLDDVKAREKKALDQIKDAIKENGDDIAALIIEPIQGEGGDNHFRNEFLKELRNITLENEIIYILDEVQTGVGITGKMWAYQNFDFEPDIIAFGKKTQICGILASRRIDEIEDNVFNVSSRINSTWGGNLVDAVRFARFLQIIDEEKMVDNAKRMGKYLVDELENLQSEFPKIIGNARGLGLFAAVDFPDTKTRDDFRKKLFEKRFIFLPCGTRTIRFRPMLNITKEEIDLALKTWREILNKF